MNVDGVGAHEVVLEHLGEDAPFHVPRDGQAHEIEDRRRDVQDGRRAQRGAGPDAVPHGQDHAVRGVAVRAARPAIAHQRLPGPPPGRQRLHAVGRDHDQHLARPQGLGELAHGLAEERGVGVHHFPVAAALLRAHVAEGLRPREAQERVPHDVEAPVVGREERRIVGRAQHRSPALVREVGSERAVEELDPPGQVVARELGTVKSMNGARSARSTSRPSTARARTSDARSRGCTASAARAGSCWKRWK